MIPYFIYASIATVAVLLIMLIPHNFNLNWLDAGEVIISIFGGLVFGAVILAIVSGIVNCEVKKDYVIEGEWNLRAIEDNVSMSSRYYAGHGNVDGSLKYYFLLDEEDGVQVYTVPASKAIIVDKEGEIPRYVSSASKFHNTIWKYLSLELKDYKYKLYVPKGTIKYNYNIDLK